MSAKEDILEEAATNITCSYCCTTYPEDLEPFYEDGMSEKDITKVFVKAMNLEREA